MRPDPLLLLGAFSLLCTVGCDRQPKGGGAATPAAAPAVTVIKPEKRAVNRVIEQPGTIQAFEETVLYPKVPGYVQNISIDPNKADHLAHDRLIDIGSRVKKDQVLAELSVPELQEEYKQKEAIVRQGEAEVVQSKKALAASAAGVSAAKAMVAETKAGLTRAQALFDRWESEAARVNRLVSSGVIDTQTRDETLNQFKAAEATRSEVMAKVISAEAAVTKAEADQDKAVADVVATEARLDVAKADVRRVDALREYLRVKAPFDGIVTRAGVNTGDYVMADGKHGLFTVARIDPVRVVLNVPEADAGLVEAGQEVRIALQAIAGPPTLGKVIRTSWSLEPGSRTLRTEVDLPNPDAKVRPGMYVNARLTAVLPSQWAIPANGVGKVNDEPVIYLVEGGKAVRMAVELLRGDAQFTQFARYKRPGASEWTAVTGDERIATPASAVSDGQSIP